MTYKYKPFIEAGVNGYTLHAHLEEDDRRLGIIDGWVYVHTTKATTQDDRIDWQEVTLSDSEKETLKKQLPHKDFVRMKIDDIGDIKDYLADAMKLIEFNMLLTTRLAGDLWGTNALSDEMKKAYKDRNKVFLDTVDAGGISLRGDFEDMTLVMERMFKRVSMTNELVNKNYVSKLKDLELM